MDSTKRDGSIAMDSEVVLLCRILHRAMGRCDEGTNAFEVETTYIVDSTVNNLILHFKRSTCIYGEGGRETAAGKMKFNRKTSVSITVPYKHKTLGAYVDTEDRYSVTSSKLALSHFFGTRCVLLPRGFFFQFQKS
jgi:hypothetical protein